MKSRTFVLLAVIFCVTGIAWAGTMETLEKLTAGYQLPAEPTKGHAMIYVIRPTSDLGHENVYVYHDDGKGETLKGQIKGMDYMYFEVDPGKHCIVAEAKNKRGVCFQVKENETVFLKQTLTADRTGEVEYLDVIEPSLAKYYVSTAIYSKDHKKQ